MNQSSSNHAEQKDQEQDLRDKIREYQVHVNKLEQQLRIASDERDSARKALEELIQEVDLGLRDHAEQQSIGVDAKLDAIAARVIQIAQTATRPDDGVVLDVDMSNGETSGRTEVHNFLFFNKVRQLGNVSGCDWAWQRVALDQVRSVLFLTETSCIPLEMEVSLVWALANLIVASSDENEELQVAAMDLVSFVSSRSSLFELIAREV